MTTLLYNDKPIPLADLEALIRPESHRQREDAFSKLRRLHIIAEAADGISLDPVFKKNFRLALTGGGSHHSFGVPCNTPDKKNVTVAFLDEYAQKKFESILHFMVGTHNDTKPGDGVIELLCIGKLMERQYDRPPRTVPTLPRKKRLTAAEARAPRQQSQRTASPSSSRKATRRSGRC